MKKNILLSSSRAFSLSTPTFSLSIPTFPLSTPVDNSEATWKKATKCNKFSYSEGKAQHCIARLFVLSTIT